MSLNILQMSSCIPSKDAYNSDARLGTLIANV